MSAIPMNANPFLPTRETRSLLIKWVIALLLPLLVFNYYWQGDALVNQVVLGFANPANALVDMVGQVQAVIFILLFYVVTMALAGYLVAADSGRRHMFEVWIDVVIFVVVPIVLIVLTNDNLIIGLALCGIVWPIYFVVRKRIPFLAKLQTQLPSPLESLRVLSSEQKAELVNRGKQGGFWFGLVLAVAWLLIDLTVYLVNGLPTVLLILAAVRTIALPVAGYFLGWLGGVMAVRRTFSANGSKAGENNSSNGSNGTSVRRRQRELSKLASTRGREEAQELVPNDLPLRSSGARRFFLTLLVAFLIFYPVLDPFLFGFGTIGRLSQYTDAGYYVILALGLNIVVGFAGLLDLGYVAFFAIGAYAWGIFGSTQFGRLTALIISPQILSGLFWPMLIVVALIAALFGVILGAPTLRLRGDYLAIVTLGFGEIVPVVFLNLDKYTNGTNGIVGIRSPSFFGVNWSNVTPLPYYYLILALIALVIFANVRLRDSRLGRAWIAIREDEIAAASSGVNLVRTKLFAFGTGAFFSGIAGAYFSAKLGNVSPDLFSFGDSVIYLAMVVIGGLGSIPGVIVGALVVYSINLFILNNLDTLASDPTNFLYGIDQFIIHYIPSFTFGNIRNLLFGIILVVIMIFRPEGLIPSARRRRELHQAPEIETSELGSLDVTPSDPGFESEVRIE
jgi:ABC-type branched-subunit amino acid transport system permease subunit